MANLRVTSPLKLPKAPKFYDESDQDRTRRLIEMAVAAYTRQLQGVADAIGAEASDIGYRFDPISPIHGTVHTASTASTPPYVQLLNPSGSGKILVLYEFRIGTGTSQAVRARITQVPADLAGTVPGAATITTAFTEHRDENDAASVNTTLKGTTNIVGTPFTLAVAHWSDTIQTETTNTLPRMKWLIGRAGDYSSIFAAGYKGNTMPLILQPGDALELVGNTVNTTLRCYALFDELSLTGTVGVLDPTDPTAPRSSCWANLTQTGSINFPALIQLFNPGPHIAKITTLNVLANAAAYAQIYRTAVPSTLAHAGSGGTLAIGLATRMARRDQLGVECKLQGANTHLSFGGNRLVWRDKGHIGEGLPYESVVGPHSAPLYLMPGSALEMVNEANGNIPISMMVHWDEVNSVA